jgi:hypothetical protein
MSKACCFTRVDSPFRLSPVAKTSRFTVLALPGRFPVCSAADRIGARPGGINAFVNTCTKAETDAHKINPY